MSSLAELRGVALGLLTFTETLVFLRSLEGSDSVTALTLYELSGSTEDAKIILRLDDNRLRRFVGDGCYTSEATGGEVSMEA